MPKQSFVQARLLAALVLSITGACSSDSKPKKILPVPGYVAPDGGYDTSDSSITAAGCDGEAVGTVETRVRYLSAAVSADATCSPQNQQRECGADGTWSAWSGDYFAETCEVAGLASCDGSPHASVETRDRYELGSVSDGGECNKESQTRTCTDGTWGEWSGSFTFETCATDEQSCGDTPSGETEERLRYESATVQPGETCEPETQTRTCDDGEWSEWTGTLSVENCVVLEHKSCGDSAHGTVEERTRYEAQVVAVGEDMQARGAGAHLRRRRVERVVRHAGRSVLRHRGRCPL